MGALSGDTQIWLIMSIAIGYLFGSIPFGLVLCRLSGLGDIRNIGSGNIGATNVLRTGNKPLAFITLLLDASKGAIAVYIFLTLAGPLAATLAGVFGVVGHNFPIWLKFKGGKGVATTLGTLISLAWPVGLAACFTWLIVAVVFRMSSLSALLALSVAPIYSWYLGIFELTIASGFLAALSWIRHYENIRRIIAGKEPKIGDK